MAITERDLQGLFMVIRGAAQDAVAADLPAEQREQIVPLVEAALGVVASIAIDINRAADALESLARTEMDRFQRELGR